MVRLRRGYRSASPAAYRQIFNDEPALFSERTLRRRGAAGDHGKSPLRYRPALNDLTFSRLFDKGDAIAGTSEQSLQRRRKNHPQHRFAVFDQGDIDGELAITVDELPGSVQWIHQPEAQTNRRFGMHNGHTPEIEVNGDEATGLWYLNDVFINLNEQTLLNGSAIYEDRYVKRHGEWRILQTGYKRLLEMIGPLDVQWRITSQPIN
jgi:hypothetical protein